MADDIKNYTSAAYGFFNAGMQAGFAGLNDLLNELPDIEYTKAGLLLLIKDYQKLLNSEMMTITPDELMKRLIR